MVCVWKFNLIHLQTLIDEIIKEQMTKKGVVEEREPAGTACSTAHCHKYMMRIQDKFSLGLQALQSEAAKNDWLVAIYRKMIILGDLWTSANFSPLFKTTCRQTTALCKLFLSPTEKG